MQKLFNVIKENMKYILQKLSEVNTIILIVILFLTILTSLIPVAISLVTKEILDYLTKYMNGGNNTQQEFMKLVFFLLILSIGLKFGNSLIRYIQNYYGIIYKKMNMIQNVSKMSSLKMECFDNPNVHFLFDMSSKEANVNPFAIIFPFVSILSTFITMITYFIILLKLNILIAILPLFLAIPLVIIGGKKEVWEYECNYNAKIMDLNRRIQYFTSIVKEPLYAKENIIYNVGNFFIEKRRKYKDSLIDKRLVFMKKTLYLSIVLTFITVLSQYSVYLFLGINTLIGNVSLGEITLYFNAFSVILLSFNSVIDSITYISAQSKMYNIRKEFFDLPVCNLNQKKKFNVKKGKHRITFRNVTFRYPYTERNIIQNLSFSIEPDDIVAIIGQNGCGKSTLIKLIIGHYLPQEGKIEIDGVDIDQYSQSQLSNIFGAMFQEVAHMALPIREFITMSMQEFNNKKFNDAITRAECKNIVDESVLSYETIMTYSFNKKNAREFSGGEWQKMAMARLFYKNSDIFIMDEPTSALDAEAEYRFFANVKSMSNNHNIIMVSHRLSIAKLCTKIIYFDKDKIFIGSHEQLMQKASNYRKLYELQKLMYFD